MLKKICLFSILLVIFSFSFVKDVKAVSGSFIRTYSGGGGNSIIKTSDGGYIVVGSTGHDALLLKFNSEDTLEWQRNFGRISQWGMESMGGNSIVQTSDGGYIVVGVAEYWGNGGGTDILFMKLDSSGNLCSDPSKCWIKALGGNQWDMTKGPVSISPTADGGYVIVGSTNSWGPAGANVLVTKLNSSGNIVWNTVTGKGGDDRGKTAAQTPDGGYIVTGSTGSWGSAGGPVLVIRLDSNGNPYPNINSFAKAIGRIDGIFAGGDSIIKRADGTYIVVGAPSWGYEGVLLMKLDSNGNFLVGTAKKIILLPYPISGFMEFSTQIINTNDGGYAIVCPTDTGSFLLKFDSGEVLQWAKMIQNPLYSVIQTSDNDYIIVGGGLILRTDENGNIPSCSLWQDVTADIAIVSTDVIVDLPPPPKPSVSNPTLGEVSSNSDVPPLSLTMIQACPPPCQDHNVWGWAWAENIGWISFSCKNCDSDSDGITDTGNYSQCPVGDSIINYGVDIDNNGLFSGYAWAGGTTANLGGIGWIKFDPAVPYPTAPSYSACLDLPGPGQDCDNVGDCTVSGWARAYRAIDSEGQTLGGWDGWIKFRGTIQTGEAYGVRLNTSGSPAPAEFREWAWGGDDSTSTAVLGWTSFNCADRGVCGSSPYKVMTSPIIPPNQPPYIESKTVSESYCNVFAGQGRVDFQWIYRDDDLDHQTQFDFRVNDVNNVNDASPEIDRIVIVNPPNNLDGNTNNQVVIVGSEINFNTPYYWWAKVYDNQGNDSGWVAGPSFTTDAHAYPYPDFTHTPQNPSAGQVITFTDTSDCYSSPGNTEYDCQDDSLGVIQYAWDFDYDTPPDFTDSYNEGDATTTYSQPKTPGYEVRLKITDNTLPGPDNYCIGKGDSPVGISPSLPNWTEVPPF